MAATVTIDKSYFETLLRRYVQHTIRYLQPAKFLIELNLSVTPMTMNGRLRRGSWTV